MQKKFYETNWLLWITLILLPPVGIVLLWMFHKENKHKKGLSIFFALWFVFLVFGEFTDPEAPTENRETKEEIGRAHV